MLVCFVGGKSTDLVQTWLKTEARGLKPLGSQRAARESVRGPLPGAGLCVPTFQQPARCERLNPLGSSAPRPVGTCLSPFLPPSIPSSRLCCIPGLLRSVPSGPGGVTEAWPRSEGAGSDSSPSLGEAFPWLLARGRDWVLGV